MHKTFAGAVSPAVARRNPRAYARRLAGIGTRGTQTMKPAALFVALLLAAPSALAQYGPQPVAEAPQGPPAATANVGLDQRLNESVPLDLPFRDEDGHTVMLGDFFHGKPVVLVLAYYRCPMLCTQVLAGLVDSL